MRYMQYACKTSMRGSRNGPPSWKRFKSGNALDTSASMASKQSIRRLLLSLGSSVLDRRSLARCSALVYASSVNSSSLPIARFHIAPRFRGGIPRHHSSRVRGSRSARSQLGLTKSSQMFWRASRVLSFSHWADAACAALRLSEQMLKSESYQRMNDYLPASRD